MCLLQLSSTSFFHTSCNGVLECVAGWMGGRNTEMEHNREGTDPPSPSSTPGVLQEQQSKSAHLRLVKVRRRPGLEGAHVLVEVDQVQAAKTLQSVGVAEGRSSGY